ncbi:MAG: GTPase Era [Alphaproteobacteria bacterium]|nr:GTPase Era [Alphaproteobacteria bacterium]
MSESEVTRCGVVAVIGAPNAGKSTLINRLVGSKVTIVSPKVQTTRARVRGVVIRGAVQLIVVDTPGIFRPRRQLDEAMVAAAWGGLEDADAALLLVDAREAHANPQGPAAGDTQRIIEALEQSGRKVDLALNKIDLVPRPALLTLAERFATSPSVGEIFMIAAENGDGVDHLLAHLCARARPGPWLFPEDQAADVPSRLLAAEVTREKLFLRLHEELPYASTVETESWKAQKDGSVRIDQIIYVERDGQKAIVIGKGGQTLKQIGAAARHELEEMLGHRVHLFVHVKVRPGWAQERARMTAIGLEPSKAKP